MSETIEAAGPTPTVIPAPTVTPTEEELPTPTNDGIRIAAWSSAVATSERASFGFSVRGFSTSRSLPSARQRRAISKCVEAVVAITTAPMSSRLRMSRHAPSPSGA